MRLVFYRFLDDVQVCVYTDGTAGIYWTRLNTDRQSTSCSQAGGGIDVVKIRSVHQAGKYPQINYKLNPKNHLKIMINLNGKLDDYG